MENASKALIIAGAILLSILLITLGIMIFSQAQDTIHNSGMTQAEITTFNNQFLKYEGKQKGSVVKAMINEVIASNADENHQNNGATVEIEMPGSNSATGSGSQIATSGSTITTKGIETSKTYNISLEYGKNGRVSDRKSVV